MTMIERVETGLIHRNPKPHLRSEQAYFPSVARYPDGEMVAAFGVGSAFESVDAHTRLARSFDGGRSWATEAPLYEERDDPPTSWNVRISLMPEGELVAVGARWDRSRTEMGLVNSETFGFVPTELILLRSEDRGHTWQGPYVIEPPLEGPSFEVCHPVKPLRDGRWLWPTATWTGWDGYSPNGMKAIVLVSHDRGDTWPEYVDVMDGTDDDIVYWEQKVVELDGSRLMAVCWTHDRSRDEDLPVHFAISEDCGRSFGPPKSTGLRGQTTTPLYLGHGRVLSIYRRTDHAGLWADLSSVDGETWVSEAEAPLWGADGRQSDRRQEGMSLSEEMSSLRFGLPLALKLPDGHIFVAFWCVEDCISVIRWFRLAIHE